MTIPQENKCPVFYNACTVYSMKNCPNYRSRRSLNNKMRIANQWEGAKKFNKSMQIYINVNLKSLNFFFDKFIIAENIFGGLIHHQLLSKLVELCHGVKLQRYRVLLFNMMHHLRDFRGARIIICMIFTNSIFFFQISDEIVDSFCSILVMHFIKHFGALFLVLNL